MLQAKADFMRPHPYNWNSLLVFAFATFLIGCPGEEPDGSNEPIPEAQTETPSANTDSTTQAANNDATDAPEREQEDNEQSATASAEDASGRDGGTSNDEFVRPARRGDDDSESVPYETRVKLAAEPIPAPFIADLMTRQDIRRNFGYDGPLHETDLPGRPTSPTYQSLRFSTEEEFGFSVELMKTETRTDVIRLVRDLRNSWLESSGEPRLGYGASGRSMGIRSMVIGSVSTSFVAIVSCSEELCSEDQLLAMALEAKNRLETGESR